MRYNGAVWTWGYNFYGQLGDDSTTQRLTPVLVSTYTDDYTLSVTIIGAGTVNSTPTPDINCTDSCDQTYPGGTVVTLTASPFSGYTFSGWTGACTGTDSCQITMDNAKNVTATFADITPPDTNITLHPESSTTSTSFSFSFTSTETGSTFQCSMSGGSNWSTCASPYAGSVVYAQCTSCRTDSHMNFYVRAIDAKNNIDPTPASYAWTINHTIESAFANVMEGGVVQLKAADLAGNFDFDRTVAFTLKGGYDDTYSTSSGFTNIHGSITISAGLVTLDGITIL
jgi:uncharacterized repeat protein (TIGR02543 family)